MNNNEFLNKAADKSGFIRTTFQEKNVTTSLNEIVVLPFFGDIRSLVIASSILLKRIREETKGSKYFILCSWQGFDSAFPYVDEFWTFKDKSKKLIKSSRGFINDSDVYVKYLRNLNQFFEEVINADIFSEYYNEGLTQKMFDQFKHIKVYLPDISSTVILGNEFNRELNLKSGKKIFLYPQTFIYGWKYGRQSILNASLNFWESLVQILLENGYIPIISQDNLTHDLSNKFVGKCIFLQNLNFQQTLSAMRSSDLVLDVFTSISRLALLARIPFVALEDRTYHSTLKEYEIDSLIASKVPKEYIFSFPNIVENCDEKLWKNSLFDCIINRLESYFSIAKESVSVPGTQSYEIVPYSEVKQKKIKKFGTRFIRVNQWEM